MHELPSEIMPSGLEIGRLPVLLSKDDRKIVYSYSGMVDTVDKEDFAVARDLQGLDEDIALLRVFIGRLLQNDPYNFTCLLKALEVLAAMIELQNEIEITRSG